MQNLLPNEEYYYLADSRHAPYGDKPPEEILSPYLFLLGPDGKSLNGKSLDAQ